MAPSGTGLKGLAPSNLFRSADDERGENQQEIEAIVAAWAKVLASDFEEGDGRFQRWRVVVA